MRPWEEIQSIKRPKQARSLATLCTLVLFITICLWGRICAAETCPSFSVSGIVLLSAAECCPNRAWPEVERAVSDELRLLGYSISTMTSCDVDENKCRYDLERMVSERNETAVVWITRESAFNDEVRIWILAGHTGGTITRSQVVSNEEYEDSVMVAALLGVASIRTNLNEMAEETCAKEESAPPSPETPEEPKTPTVEQNRTFNAYAGGILSGAPGGVGVRGGFAVGAGWYPIAAVGLEFEGAYLPFGRDIETERARTSLSLTAVRLSVLWQFLRKQWIAPALVLNGGVLFLNGEGESGTDVTLRSETATVAYMGLGVHLRIFPVSKRVSISLGGGIGITVPEFEIYHGNDRAARLSRPLFDALLNVEFWFS